MARQDLVNAIQKGLQVRGSGPRGGCGRAYVYLSSTADKKSLNEFKAAIAAAGLRYLGKAYGVGSSRTAYVGYDNADGVALAQAEAISANLRALGLPVYDDAVSD